VGEGQKVGPDLGVEAFRGLEQADLPEGDQVIHLQRGAELLAHLGGQAPHVGPVLLEDLLAGFA
jgi:hypothetical protein